MQPLSHEFLFCLNVQVCDALCGSLGLAANAAPVIRLISFVTLFVSVLVPPPLHCPLALLLPCSAVPPCVCVCVLTQLEAWHFALIGCLRGLFI